MNASFPEIASWFIDHLPYEAYVLNEQGEIQYANRTVCKSLGYSKKELEGLDVFAINPKTTAESWARHWRIVQEEEVNYFKTWHKRKDGKLIHVEVFAQFFSNNGKKFICSLIRDISSSRLYRELLEQTEAAVKLGGWEWDRKEGDVIASAQALNIFGSKDSGDLLPQKVIAYFPGEEGEKLKMALAELIRDHHPYSLTLKGKSRDGTNKWIEAKARPILYQGQVIKLQGTYQDITRQKEMERSLMLSRETIDNTMDMIYWIRPDGSLARTNKAVEQILGFSAEELKAMTLFDIDPLFPRGRWKSHWDEIRKKGSFVFESSHQRKNGTMMTVEVKVNYLHLFGREYNCAIVRDITERKQRELKLVEALQEIRELKAQIEAENEYFQEEIRQEYNFEGIICQSEAYRNVLDEVEKVAPGDTTVLITGESGTGKELLARAIHQLSKRKDRPLIKVNCAALPKDLIESELFGHKKGAFTGAIADKAGRFELADEGTLFLDEIGELPLELQPKLLRAIQEGEFDRLGDSRTSRVNVRIIAATNRDLEKMVAEGSFREDLYNRLNVFPVHNIPLRERPGDIPLLAQHFLERFSLKLGKRFTKISTQAIRQLEQYDFPGNIRELENLMERAIIMEKGPVLKADSWLPGTESAAPRRKGLLTFEQAQRDIILQVLTHTRWRVSGPKGAAGILDMNPKTLFAKMKKLGIRKEDYLK
jgi:PAS domain S-box-containing protein